MKAEHRKELQTNVLADWMGRTLQSIKSGPPSNATIIWGAGLLVLLAAGVWYWSSGTSPGRSALWVRLEGDNDPEDLKKIAEEFKGTMPARVARFQRARILLRSGLEDLYSSYQRPDAIENLEEARRLYQALSKEVSGDPVLMQEALLGSAKIEEALIGAPKADKSEGTRGTLDRAIELYRDLANKYPDTFVGRTAKEHADDLFKNRENVVKFYGELNTLADSGGSKK